MHVEKQRASWLVCWCAFWGMLVYTSLGVANATVRDTDRDYTSTTDNIVWRANRDINLYTPKGSKLPLNFDDIHADLKKSTEADRERLRDQQDLEKVIVPVIGKGNCASACLSIVYANGKVDNRPVVSHMCCGRPLSEAITLNGFTTLRAKINRNNLGIGITIESNFKWLEP